MKLSRVDGPPPGGPDENELFARVIARDVDAFEVLYRKYQQRLVPFLTRMLRRPQLVEEVLNDTMMVVWQRGDRFRGASRLSTWIFAIAYRTALKTRSRWPQPVEDRGLDSRVSREPEPDAHLAQQRLHDAILKAMAELSPEHRAVIDLTYFQGFGYHEIADIANCPVNTVKTRMFHARRKLREGLSGVAGDWL